MSNNQATDKTNSTPHKNALAITKKVLGIICYVLFAIIFVVVLWLGFDKFILKSPVPSMFGYSSLTVETGSMESTLQIGDLILIKDTDDYKIGDIVTYIREGDKIPTTHRIINYAGEDAYVTKGDANNSKDMDDVTKDMILGEVVKVFPKAGLFSKWIKAEGWIYIIAILVLVAIGMLVLSSEDSESKEDGEENKNDNETLKENAEEKELKESKENESSDNSSPEATE